MLTGMVFDIREFAVHDGPGVRTTVFLKGCPLRCAWCHNPEGISSEPQIVVGAAGSRLVGRRSTSSELAALLNGQADILRAAEGGVTFSGGEPLLQAAFVAEVIEQLEQTHVLLDTSGYGSAADFQLLLGMVDLVYFDLKVLEPVAHRRHTGRDNGPILRNFATLAASTVPYIVRVPLVPGVTDTDENLAAIAEAVRGAANLLRVDLLPYNRAAGGKYGPCGMGFHPTYDESRPLNTDTSAFAMHGIPAKLAARP
jgi:pyruvate formate lyase activating enzyme